MKKSITYNRSEARRILPTLVDEVNDSGSTVYISERGVKQAVLISYKAFKRLSKKKSQGEFLASFAGMWSDREDMKDSVKWVNETRKKSERIFKW
jgi:prevent-host-death family protein